MNLTIPLFVPPEKRGEYETLSDWLHDFGERAFGSIPSSMKRWDRSRDGEALGSLRDVIGRVVEELRKGGKKVAQMTGRGMIEYRYVKPDELEQRGDFRYGSQDLAKTIQSGKDLVPIVAGSSDGGKHVRVLDGHHRMRAYQIAGRPMPAFIGWVEPGDEPATLSFVAPLREVKMPRLAEVFHVA